MFFSKNRDVDMSTGPLLGNILLFALPIMAMNILQLVFNAADMIVVGRFSGREALAAVGATGSLINLIVTLFMGLSVGTSVIVAQDYGANRQVDVSRSVHTSIAVSIISGAIVMIAGIVFCKPLLEIMGTPLDIIDLFGTIHEDLLVGMPASMVYNLVQRSCEQSGDSRRPMYYLL